MILINTKMCANLTYSQSLAIASGPNCALAIKIQAKL
jgi:hypothetical protein